MNGAYEDELAAFAEQLSDLHIAVGRPSHSEISKRAVSVALPKSTVNDALHGKRLPKREFLIALVRVLVACGDNKDTVRISHDDPRLVDWVERWNRLARLEKQRRRVQPDQPAARTLPAGPSIEYERPPRDASSHQLEAAKEGLQEILADLKTYEDRARDEFRELLDEKAQVEAELRELERELGQQRADHAELKRKIGKLERDRLRLDRQVRELRQRLNEIPAERLALVEEQNEILTWQHSNAYEWGRYETRTRERIEAEMDAVRGTLSKEITRLTDELADSARKLAAADLLIRDLKNR
ncbi:hypothetical protein [Streptomyces chartreusis]|uniref:hypothetical protein n=1 Tax=Streptomyces chartreusis TaxID=1969 RepID=UPI00386FE555|nr:hypothetical protein OG938_01705 [Streptomyces chartreusis]